MTEPTKQRKPEKDAAQGGKPPAAGTDRDRDKTLTEKAEEKAGGTNKNAPGPIYDV